MLGHVEQWVLALGAATMSTPFQAALEAGDLADLPIRRLPDAGVLTAADLDALREAALD
jgi:hypothetical protein